MQHYFVVGVLKEKNEIIGIVMGVFVKFTRVLPEEFDFGLCPHAVGPAKV